MPGARVVGWAWTLLRRYPVIPVAVLLIVLVIPALFADLIAPHDPIDGNLRARLLPPAWTDGGDWSYPLGSDRQGRDILSRMIFGARTAALVSLAALAVGGIIGSVLGLVAGYFGSWWDHVIMRLVDINLSLPLILLALVLVVLFEPGTATTVAVVALLLWSRYARQVRAEVLTLNSESDQRALDRWRRGQHAATGHVPAGAAGVAPQPGPQPGPGINVYALYEDTIGPITPQVAAALAEAEGLYPAAWIEDAFREAAELNKRSWRYIQRILERWDDEGREDDDAPSERRAGWRSASQFDHLIRR